MPVQLQADVGLDTYQQNMYTQLACGENRSLDFDTRGMISPHGIQGDRGHLSTSLKRVARET